MANYFFGHFDYFLLAYPLKLAKIIGVCEVKSFFKIGFNNIKCAQIYFFFTKLATSELGQNQIQRKNSLDRPPLFLPVLGG